MTFGSLAEMVSLGSIVPFLGALVSPDELLINPYLQPFFSVLGVDGAAGVVETVVIIFCLVSALSCALRILILRISLRYAFGLGMDLSAEAFRRTLYQPYKVHIANNSSEVINGISVKISEVIFYIVSPAMLLINAVFMAIAVFLTLCLFIPFIALSVLVIIGLVYVIIVMHLKSMLRKNSELIALESSNSFRHLQDGLGGIRDILLDSSQQIFVSTFRRSDSVLRNAQGENQFLTASPRYVIESLGMILIALLGFWFSSFNDGIVGAIPMLATLAIGLQRLLPMLQQIYGSWSAIQGAHGSLRSALELIRQPISLQLSIKRELLQLKKEIILKDVSFQYSAESPLILDSFNLVIPRGSRVGLIGPTGGGKTTLTDIIMGFLEPTHGKLLVDGVPINSRNVDAWRAHIAHVPQNLFLKDGTILENIAFGVEEIDEQSIRVAARKARISDEIESWPEKYHTRVGERGIQLSGGQRQRIGIARALYKKADVIIFDEATSALENSTEEAVMRSIEGIDSEVTVLIVAHRLSTLTSCDEIIDLSKVNGAATKVNP
jgi:ATP-binding cassette subfamily B protein